MSKIKLTLTLALVSCTVGCGSDPKSAKGFTLPDGDAAQGEASFIELRCYECHTVSGIEFPAVEESAQAIVRLGGEVTKVKTYGELVTSIINPSHRIARGYQSAQVSTSP